MPVDYIPRTDAARAIWYANFNNKLPVYAASVGISAADIASVAADYATLVWMLNCVEVFKQESQERVTYKNTVMNGNVGSPAPVIPTVNAPAPPETVAAPGIVARTRALAARIKAAPAYTEAMGRDLGIVGAGEVPPAVPRPTATASAKGGSVVEIKWVKNGFDGVQIEGRRNNEPLWLPVGVAMRSPWKDTRAALIPGTAEIRSYRLRYLRADMPVGDLSDTVTVSTIP